jgi:hypothetical protein
MLRDHRYPERDLTAIITAEAGVQRQLHRTEEADLLTTAQLD